MKYSDAWEELRQRLEEDANQSGEMMSLMEHLHSTLAARNYLALMNELEEKHE